METHRPWYEADKTTGPWYEAGGKTKVENDDQAPLQDIHWMSSTPFLQFPLICRVTTWTQTSKDENRDDDQAPFQDIHPLTTTSPLF